nr:immunoglobulin heavy chain junction region [Mus musculus]
CARGGLLPAWFAYW